MTFLRIMAVMAVHLVTQLILTIFVTIIVTIQFIITGGTETDFMAIFDMIIAWTPAILIVSGIITLIIFWLFYKIKGKSLFVVSRFNKITVLQGIIATIFGMSLLFLNAYIAEFVSYIFPLSLEGYESTMESLFSAGPVVLFIAIAIMAPIVEEVMFRGLIFKHMEGKTTMIWIILIQAVLFGAYHMNIIQASFATVMGVVLGFSLLFTNSLWVPILIHFGNNALSLILHYSGYDNFASSNQPISITISLVAILAIIPLCSLYFYKKRVVYVPPVIEAPVSTQVKYVFENGASEEKLNNEKDILL